MQKKKGFTDELMEKLKMLPDDQLVSTYLATLMSFKGNFPEDVRLFKEIQRHVISYPTALLRLMHIFLTKEVTKRKRSRQKVLSDQFR